MTKLPSRIKISTGFRTKSAVDSTIVRGVYSILGVTDASTEATPAFDIDPDKNNALFIFRVLDTSISEPVSVADCEYVGPINPEHLNLTDRVNIKDSSASWWDLNAAEPKPDTAAPHQINDAVIIPSATAEHGGYFRSSVRVCIDMVPGVTSDRSKINEYFKTFVDSYKKVRALSTCMDSDTYPDGWWYPTNVGTSKTKMELAVKATAQTMDGSAGDIKYIITAFVSDIKRVLTNASLGLPKDIFLYAKADTTAGVTEKVVEGTYLRVIDPSDIQTTNPTTFGSNGLIWGADTDTGDTVLQPSTSSLGYPITDKVYAEGALAPADTFNNTGYYKSRVYIFATRNVGEAATSRSLLVSAAGAFLTKYDAWTKSLSNGSYDYFETEDFS